MVSAVKHHAAIIPDFSIHLLKFYLGDSRLRCFGHSERKVVLSMTLSTMEDGPAIPSQDGLGFDVSVFQRYLQTLLPPGENYEWQYSGAELLEHCEIWKLKV